MTEEERPLRRTRANLLAESAVIVLSIFFAFWVDASWDVFTARGRTQNHLEAVRSELVGNLEILETEGQACVAALNANLHLASLIEAHPVAIPVDSLSSLINRSFPGPPPPLHTSALQAMITGGELVGIRSLELQASLTAWLSGPVAERERLGVLHAGQLQKTIDYLAEVMPLAHLTNPLVQTPPSGFELDVLRVLSDPKIESVLTNLGVLKGFLCRRERLAQDTVRELVVQLAEELGGGAT